MGFFKNLFKSSEKQPVHVTDDNFHDEVISSELPVILDVWGTNCAPCDQLMPIIMKLAAKYDGQIKVCEMLADENPKTVIRNKIQGTPTVLYFKPGGKLVERVVGFRQWLYHIEIIENELLVEEPVVKTKKAKVKTKDDVPPPSERGVSKNPAKVKATRNRRKKKQAGARE